MNIQQAIQWGQSQLPESDSAKLDAELILAHCIDQNRTFLFTWPDKELASESREQFNSLIARRAKGEPVAYLIGHQGFWTLDLEVAPHTLIPRPETEIMVEAVLEIGNNQSVHSVLDLGTGTGAIALAVASEQPKWQLTGVDLVEDAVALAKRNKTRNKIQNCTFHQSDWFTNVSGKFDLIVSNPPYICEQDPHLNQGDVRFEPKSALTSGDDGLDDIRLISDQATEYLNDQGWVLVEHGYDQGPQVRAILERHYSAVETLKDLGNRDRISIGHFTSGS